MLNNHGKSFFGMLMLFLVMLICLIVIGYYCYILFSAVNESEGNDYLKLETKLSKATLKYNKTYGYDDEVVSLDTLRKLGYISDFNDLYGNPCKGYVVINNYVYTPYVKCEKYATDNYGL